MSKLGTTILFLAVALIGVTGAFMAFKAASMIFAIHMSIIALASVIFLIFIARRASFDPPQG
jgi:multisubunit Na+/H+ antiporter MnhC subunit